MKRIDVHEAPETERLLTLAYTLSRDNNSYTEYHYSYKIYIDNLDTAKLIYEVRLRLSALLVNCKSRTHKYYNIQHRMGLYL